MASKGPRILFYDLETSHNLVASFDIYFFKGGQIPFENILKERFVICAAWKWLGEKQVHEAHVDFADLASETPDKFVLASLIEAIEQADIIVAHNGDAYDMRYINTRGLKCGLPRVSPVQSIDTLKIAKANFMFNSNRLDYLARFLGLGSKIKIPNKEWLKILQGDEAALAKMVRYNKMDVRLLEKVYLKLRPWAPKLPVFSVEGQFTCPTCFSTRTKSKGRHTTATRSYQRRICLNCGNPFPARTLVTKTVLEK